MTLLLRGGTIRTADGTVSAMATDGDRVVWLGDDDGAAAYDGADEVVDLQGRLVAPAFVDSHLHLVQTGRQLDGLDLTGCSEQGRLPGSRGAPTSRARPGDTVVIGAGWDETRWPERILPTADELERVAPGRRLYLSRVDGHSAIVSHALLAETPQVRTEEGWAAAGRLERRAKHTVSDKLADLDGPEQRLDAARRAVAALAAYGIGAFHENAAPHIGPEYELDLVRRAAAEGGLHVTAYWGELGAFDKVERLGVAGLAGDLVADGAVGSRTASMHDAVRRPGRPLRPRLPRRPPDRRPRRRLLAARDPGRLPLHRRRCPRRGRRGLRPGRRAGRRRRRAGRPTPARALRDAVARRHRAVRAPRAWSPASSPCSTGSGAAPTACTPNGWASAGRA